MDKKSFYDIERTGKKVPAPVVEDINKDAQGHNVSTTTSVEEAPRQITQGDNIMAEVDTAVLANGHTILANEIAGVRHDVGLAEANVRDSIGQHSGLINKNVGDNGFRIAAAEANVRDKIGETEGRLAKAVGDNRYTIASEAASLSKQLGAEAAGINTHIAHVRQEDAENFGHTRRDIKDAESTLARQLGDGFCSTDAKVLERAGDIRREGAEHTNEIIKEGLKGDYANLNALKDVRFDLATSIDKTGDRMVDRLQEHDTKMADRIFTVGRDLMDLRQGQATLAKDVELNALKTQLDAKENTRYLNDRITADGEKTRALINDLKYHDLNRGLVERNTELVNCEQDRRYYRDRWDDGRFNQLQAQFAGQWAQLQSQVQAFQSQLQETRQGMVNFGTMAGVGQSSTSNNVR